MARHGMQMFYDNLQFWVAFGRSVCVCVLPKVSTSSGELRLRSREKVASL